MDPLEGLRSFIASVVRDELKLSTTPANDEYISTSEAAKIARVTTGTIRRWVRGKQLAKHGSGARVRIRRDELDRYLTGSTVAATPEDRARRRFSVG